MVNAKDIIEVFDEINTDVPDNSFELSGIQKLSKLASEFGIKETVRAVEEYIGEDARNYYFLVKSGIDCLEELLLEKLNEDDEDEVFWSALSLLILNNELGYDTLLLFATENHPTQQYIKPKEDVYFELNKLNNELAIKLKAKIKSLANYY